MCGPRDINCFTKNKSSKDGYDYMCKECIKIYNIKRNGGKVTHNRFMSINEKIQYWGKLLNEQSKK